MTEHQHTLDIQIRMADKNDAAQISTLLHASFLEYRALYTPEGFSATALSRHHVEQRIEEGPVWIALIGDHIVGTACARETSDALYIRGMAVLPTARGHQIGKRLLDRVEEYAMQHGYKRLMLSTTPFLARAIRLYEKAGFRRTIGGPDHLHGTPLFTMVKDFG